MNARSIVVGCLIACLGAGLATYAVVHPSPDALFVQQHIGHTASSYTPSTQLSQDETEQQNISDVPAQQTGSKLREQTGEDVSLPDLAALPLDVDVSVVENAKMIRRATVLGVSQADMADPVSAMRATEAAIQTSLEPVMAQSFLDDNAIELMSPNAEQLQQAIDMAEGAPVRVEGIVSVDRSITVPSDTYVYAVDASWECNIDGPLFVVNGVHDVRIEGVAANGGAHVGVVCIDAARVAVLGCSFTGMADKAIVVGGETDSFIIQQCSLSENARGGMVVGGNASHGLIVNNEANDNGGTSNWMAGIVLTSVPFNNPFNIWEEFPNNLHYPRFLPLEENIHAAHAVVVRNNTVARNNSSGLYVDGAYRCFIEGNMLDANDKEGMCLDFGSIGCYVYANTFQANGNRARQTDDDLEKDEVLGFGRMNDGSAISKLPGVSLDNAAFNVIQANMVRENYGGGIKAVRCAMRNALIGNTIIECNQGENATFQFFGIELGNAGGPEGLEAMDFLPDYQNYVQGNYITGHHLAGIFIGNSCTGNVVSNNRIDGSGDFAILQVSELSNSLDGNRYASFSIDRSLLPF